jgi:hypothetical protein
MKYIRKIHEGLSSGKTLEDIAKSHNVNIEDLKKQLEKGVDVEKEHTDDEKIATSIAMDHLVEDPKYYDKLKSCVEKRVFLFEDFTNSGETAQSLDLWSEMKEILPSWKEISRYLKDNGIDSVDPIVDIENYIKAKHDELNTKS